MEFIKTFCSELEEDTLKIRASSLYEKFTEWASANGEHRVGSDWAFNADMKRNGIEKKAVRIDGAVVKGFVLNKSEIQITIAKLLGNAEFEF